MSEKEQQGQAAEGKPAGWTPADPDFGGADLATINIGNVCDGAALESFDTALQKVLANINDPNTSATKTRTITLTISITPKEDRTQLNTKFSCTTSVAAPIPSESRMFVAKDKDGNLYCVDKDPRQAVLFTPPKPREVPQPIQFNANR